MCGNGVYSAPNVVIPAFVLGLGLGYTRRSLSVITLSPSVLYDTLRVGSSSTVLISVVELFLDHIQPFDLPKWCILVVSQYGMVILYVEQGA